MSSGFQAVQSLYVETQQLCPRDGALPEDSTVYPEGIFPETVKCARRHCFGGAFPISELMQQMLGLRQKETDVTLPCRGWGLFNFRRCRNALRVKIRVSYKL